MGATGSDNLPGAGSLEADLLLAAGPTREHYSLVGTPYYMAPEVLDRVKYGPPVDYWALGVLLFECFAGQPPYTGDDPQAVFRAIRALKVPWHRLRKAVGKAMAAAAAACGQGGDDCGYLTHLEPLVRALLNPDQHARLGAGPEGVGAIKRHPFFAGVDWATLSTTDLGYRPAPRSFPLGAAAEAGVDAATAGAPALGIATGTAAAVMAPGEEGARAAAVLDAKQQRRRRHRRRKRYGGSAGLVLSDSLDGFYGQPGRGQSRRTGGRNRGGDGGGLGGDEEGRAAGVPGAGGVSTLSHEEDDDEEEEDEVRGWVIGAFHRADRN